MIKKFDEFVNEMLNADIDEFDSLNEGLFGGVKIDDINEAIYNQMANVRTILKHFKDANGDYPMINFAIYDTRSWYTGPNNSHYFPISNNSELKSILKEGEKELKDYENNPRYVVYCGIGRNIKNKDYERIICIKGDYIKNEKIDKDHVKDICRLINRNIGGMISDIEVVGEKDGGKILGKQAQEKNVLLSLLNEGQDKYKLLLNMSSEKFEKFFKKAVEKEFK